MKVICRSLKQRCNGCNWRVEFLYTFEGKDIEKEGLCADCFIDMLIREKYDITKDDD